MLLNAWYIAAESRELKNRPLARTVAGVPVALFRDAAGKPAALFDRCPHRNVQLSGGRVTAGRLQCPYHGWEFNREGRCVRIPALDGGHIPGGACTRVLPLIEQQDFLWLWPGERPPLEHETPYLIPHFSESGWGWGRLQGFIGNSVENIVENFIDNPHTGYIHGGLFRNPASHWSSTEVQIADDGVIIDIDEENQADSLLARLLVKGEVTHQDRFIYPSIVRVAYGFGPKRQMVGYQICTPEAELRTRLYVHVSWQMGWLNPLVKALMPIFGRVILNQDVGILENQGRMIARYGEAFTSVDADTANLWIKATRQRLARGEKPAPRKRQVRFRV
ncbi:MAG: Rieske 2Fe-2S domain-containing protein [Candidatus Sericytochromatia bacterium]